MTLPTPWMTAGSCGLRTLALVVAAARDGVLDVARHLEEVFSDTAARLGWWGPAAQSASALGRERAAQLHSAVTAAQEIVDALETLADALDEHAAGLQLAEQSRAAGDAGLQEQIDDHVQALAAVDRQAALQADDACRRLTAVLDQVGRVHWLGGFTRVAVTHAARETGALGPAAPSAGAAADGGVPWPVGSHLGDSPSCGDRRTPIEQVCSGLNGFSTGAGVLTGGIDAVTARVATAREVLANPAASAGQRAAASEVLAEVAEFTGAARIVELGTDARYAVAAGRVAPVVGGLLAGWSGYQGEVDKGRPTHVAVGVGVTEAVVDTGIGAVSVAVGAEAGAGVGAALGSVVPIAGTAVGAGVGAGVGALFAYFASNEANGLIAEAWEGH